MRGLVIGSRGSKLALRQASCVRDELAKYIPECEIEIKVIGTRGDRIRDVPLPQIGGKGLFTQEIEAALLRGEVDIAVHSMKDVPTDIPEGLKLAAITAREDPRDALIARDRGYSLNSGGTIGTSSLRRRAQLLHHYPKLRFANIRGNLDTRIRKLRDDDNLTAIVVAAAGMHRLGLESQITAYLPPSMVLPAAGQGALGVQTAEDRQEIAELVEKMNDYKTALCVSAERALLRALGGGCHVPIGALGRVREDGSLSLAGAVASADGELLIRDEVRSDGPKIDASALGEELAERLMSKGAGEILENI
ncbi:MAG: hydroxymethylbilane synthase [bacterium]